MTTKNDSILEAIDLEKIRQIAREAGEAIMEIYARDFDIEYKEDQSPLTEADTLAHEIIERGLREMRVPEALPILSEEGKDISYEERREWSHYWCVDPIDGTKEFIKKNGEFTVNIALIRDGEPVLGVVYAPALNLLYSAKRGEGAKKQVLQEGRVLEEVALPDACNVEDDTLRIVASKSHLNDETKAFIENLEGNQESGIRDTELVSRGSSLKLVMVAEGSADIYPRLAPTMEWDTAAADAIVREAGRMTYIYEEGTDYLHPQSLTSHPQNSNVQNTEPGTRSPEPGKQYPTPLKYNKENLLNPRFVVV